MIKLDCVHTMPAYFQTGENVTDRPFVHTKAAHFLTFFYRQILKTELYPRLLETASCKYLKIMENRTGLDAFGTRLVDSKGLDTLLWHQSFATSFCRLISYRFQTVPVSCEC